MTQAELAKPVGVNQQRIAKWENGDGLPSMEQGLRLARALGVSYEYFADDAADRPPLPAISEDEAAILQLYRALGLTVADGLRRLATAPIEPGPVRPGRVVEEPIDLDAVVKTPQRARDK